MVADQYPYVIIGGGVAGNSAVEGIRELDKSGPILLVAQERDLPYDRPPLSKQLWKGDQKIEEIFKHDAGFYHQNGVELLLGSEAVKLDTSAMTLLLGDGRTVSYGKLLIATGGTPRKLDTPGGDLPCYYRTVEDYRRLRANVLPGTTAIVIGGGFIGSEMAAALCISGAKVTMLITGEYLCQNVLPESLGRSMNDLYIAKGINLIAGDTTKSIRRVGELLELRTREGLQITAQVIVAGIGIVPNVGIAKAAGLKVGDGIVVDEWLATSDRNVFAAGDVAKFPHAVLGPRRVEHWDAGVSQGKAAGRNMAGAGEKYEYMPFFFSDLFEFGYEAVGDCDSKLQTVADWVEENRTGVVYYLHEGRVRGVMTCGIFGKTDEAREVIRMTPVASSETLIGKIRP